MICSNDKFATVECSTQTDFVSAKECNEKMSQFTSGIPAASSHMPAPRQCTETFYKRDLPLTCIGFASHQGRILFKEALESGTMEVYFKLADHFLTQDDPAFCGLGALTMVLNAFSIDPGRVWKGVWRWYHETLLDCCVPLHTVQEKGIVISQFACLARCNGVQTCTLVPGEISLEDIRSLVISVCSKAETDEVLVASYDRQTLGQTGSGHFSPIGGYHSSSDSVLILDVARFKYPSHWVPLATLWNSMHQLDPETRKPRGFILLQRSKSLPFSQIVAAASSAEIEGWSLVLKWADHLACRLHVDNASNNNILVSWVVFAEAVIADMPNKIADTLQKLVERCGKTDIIDGRLRGEIKYLDLYPCVTESLRLHFPDLCEPTVSPPYVQEKDEHLPCKYSTCKFAIQHVTTILLLSCMKVAKDFVLSVDCSDNVSCSKFFLFDKAFPRWSKLLQNEVSQVSDMIGGSHALSHLTNESI